MTLIIASLAVYKLIHLLTSVLPREPMPWVKVVAGIVLSAVAVLISDSMGLDNNFGNFVLLAFAVATLAGLTHTTLRLLTYLGDMAARKATK